MEIKDVVQVNVERIQDVLCNICGNSCVDEVGNKNCATLWCDWGYSSKKDGEFHLAHMCEECYDTVISAFKHPPDVDE